MVEPMKQILIASLAVLAAAAPALGQDGAAANDAAEFSAPGDAMALTGQEASAAIERASDWLNELEALRGRFQQMNTDGSISEGDFFLERPGKLRFAYDPPVPLTVIADGRVYWQVDNELETVDRIPLEETPLSFLVKENISLARDADVRGVARQDGMVLISIGDAADRFGGQMVLIFSEPEFALREWVVIDEFGQQTRVTLHDVTRAASLDPSLFVYDGERGSRRPGQR